MARGAACCAGGIVIAVGQTSLLVYKYVGAEVDFVVASSPEDASAIMAADGFSLDEYLPSRWAVCADYITVRDGDKVERRAADEWAAVNGRGHLACSYA